MFLLIYLQQSNVYDFFWRYYLFLIQYIVLMLRPPKNPNLPATKPQWRLPQWQLSSFLQTRPLRPIPHPRLARRTPRRLAAATKKTVTRMLERKRTDVRRAARRLDWLVSRIVFFFKILFLFQPFNIKCCSVWQPWYLYYLLTKLLKIQLLSQRLWTLKNHY